MKVLVCHNYYQQAGGEDQSFAQEADLLESKGHEVVRYTRHNDDIDRMSRLGAAARTLWNRSTHADLRRLIRRERPAVMHCTNTFPLISPSAYAAAHSEGVAVVQSLRNYRLMCPGAYLLREGAPCEDCVGSFFPWRSVVHRCYRGSRAGSLVVATKIGLHRAIGTWAGSVDAYFALTKFSRGRFIEGGLPAEKIHIKPNFLSPDPGAGTGEGGYALFVGRISPEKGVATLLEAWSQIGDRLPLKIVGDGPLGHRVAEAAGNSDSIEWLGRKSSAEVLALVADARCLVVPSLWYEGFPRTILEAKACGTPVVASRLGSMAEIVDHEESGMLFTPGDADDLARTITSRFVEKTDAEAMRSAARRSYLDNYTAEHNYETLIGIYEQAIAVCQTN